MMTGIALVENGIYISTVTRVIVISQYYGERAQDFRRYQEAFSTY